MSRPTCARCKLPIDYGETYQHPYGEWDVWAHTSCLPESDERASDRAAIRQSGLASYIPETQRGKIAIGHH